MLDLVLTNQERLLSTPGLVDRVSMNPALRADQCGRLLDLIDRFFDGHARKAAEQAGPGVAPDETIDADGVAKILEVDVGELYAASEIMDAEEFIQSDNPVVRSAYKRILTLNVGQKAILAMKGGREERIILVRDTNKLVALAVLKNARLTEGEVERSPRCAACPTRSCATSGSTGNGRRTTPWWPTSFAIRARRRPFRRTSSRA